MNEDTNRPFGFSESPSLPGAVKFLLALLVILALWSAVRLGAAVVFWEVLDGYPTRGGPSYIALSGAFWLVCALEALWGLATRRRWGQRAVIGVCSGYFLWYWLDRLLLRLPYPNWPFALILSAVLLPVTLGVAFHPAVRRFCEKVRHDGSKKDTGTIRT